MRSWTITIPAPGPWLTANIERFYLGRSAAVRQWREATVWACTAARLPTDITPVTIHAACHYVGRAPVRDRLNLAPTIKALVDALTPPRTFVRKGKTYTTAGYGLLPDDSDKHVLGTDWQLVKAVDGVAHVELTVREEAP